MAAAASSVRADWAPALAEAVPALVDLMTVGEGATASAPVLCHLSLNPGHVRLGPGRRPNVLGWEGVGGLPPSWDLRYALTQWPGGPDGGGNAAGARAPSVRDRAQPGRPPQA